MDSHYRDNNYLPEDGRTANQKRREGLQGSARSGGTTERTILGNDSLTLTVPSSSDEQRTREDVEKSRTHRSKRCIISDEHKTRDREQSGDIKTSGIDDSLDYEVPFIQRATSKSGTVILPYLTASRPSRPVSPITADPRFKGLMEKLVPTRRATVEKQQLPAFSGSRVQVVNGEVIYFRDVCLRDTCRVIFDMMNIDKRR
ncbi:uncharacterized protein LOC116615890 [Nematostella vectensis]|uniref:uncharacterized protein LOC116615890 n=1 Tax=Nematostella vectensis TaxID=45351 RepID=UPI0020776E2F|nr:uncharacterized protein LOC116615890 [Nematostella vectensis]